MLYIPRPSHTPFVQRRLHNSHRSSTISLANRVSPPELCLASNNTRTLRNALAYVSSLWRHVHFSDCANICGFVYLTWLSPSSHAPKQFLHRNIQTIQMRHSRGRGMWRYALLLGLPRHYQPSKRREPFAERHSGTSYSSTAARTSNFAHVIAFQFEHRRYSSRSSFPELQAVNPLQPSEYCTTSTRSAHTVYTYLRAKFSFSGDYALLHTHLPAFLTT